MESQQAGSSGKGSGIKSEPMEVLYFRARGSGGEVTRSRDLKLPCKFSSMWCRILFKPFM